MGRRRHKHYDELAIHDLSAKGKGVARAGDKVVFVNHAIPGDKLSATTTKRRKSYEEATIDELISPSPERVTPFCEHFGVCGGCTLQHADYAAQLRYKEKIVRDAFQRIAKVAPESIAPILGCDETRYYRNKLEYTFSANRWLTQQEIDSGKQFERRGLGFHKPGMFDKILDIEHCYLQPDPSNAIRLAARAYALEHDLSFYHVREHSGLLRNLMIRTSTLGELLVLVSATDAKGIKGLLEHLKREFPQITSLQYVVNTKLNDTIYDLDVKVYHGRDHIYEQLGDFRFKVGPKSFFQTNSKQAMRLYDIAKDFAGLNGDENVYDLYTGVGSIGIYLSDSCAQLTGIEEIPEAIADAKQNAELNEVSNTSFYAGDVKDILSDDFVAKHGKPDVLVTDPPRAGMHPEVVDTLLKLAAPRLVYVSCNPATQARDVQLLSEKYRVVKLQPVDMFPHTPHIENVALLELV